MAQTKRKRRRKHSGTQAGTVQRRPSTARPATKEEKREEARRRRAERMSRAPTWRGAVVRAAIAAVIFVFVVALALQRPIVEGLGLGAVMFLLYIPIGYYTDTFVYRRRQRKQAQEREERRSGKRARG